MALRIQQLLAPNPVTIGDRLQILWKVLDKAGKSGNTWDHDRNVDKNVEMELEAFFSFLEELRPAIKKKLLGCPSPGTSNSRGGTYTFSDMLAYLGTYSNQRCVEDASKKLNALLKSHLNSWLFELSIKDVILPKKSNDEKKHPVFLERKDSSNLPKDKVAREESRVNKPKTGSSIEKDQQQKGVAKSTCKEEAPLKKEAEKKLESNPSCCVWLKIITGAVMLIGSVALVIISPHLVAVYASLKFTLGVSSLIGIGLFSKGCYEICTRESQEKVLTSTNQLQ